MRRDTIANACKKRPAGFASTDAGIVLVPLPAQGCHAGRATKPERKHCLLVNGFRRLSIATGPLDDLRQLHLQRFETPIQFAKSRIGRVSHGRR